ncbi:flagellar hook-basal body protein [Aeoliella mucimassa]|uniref:Flagellar basal-body rod protein FlgG n=1 Tax=Aeoliella mucimassa TaxID=2527972 RepID=A0A518ARW0_9BACT|nr:flagellar hook-basal body protein [Aeoliella mucimassa]QDU57448.1 Flagellar basal-body rod protein FlgG [Aeoliella mucimassa]
MSAEGAKVQSRRLEVIANNLANVNTVGFKPDVAAFQSRFAEAIQRGQALDGDRSMNDVGGGVSVFDTTTDFAAGRLQKTGNQLDLAIVGDGFFQVQDAQGEQFLTRAGNFTIDSQNRVVTQNGMFLLDSGGSEIALTPGLPYSISATGDINQAGNTVQLGLQRPGSLGDLVKVGDNLFRPLAEVQPVEAGMREVRSGFLEMSGTNSTRQMMDMIETTRAFEANVRVLQSQDSMSSNLIGRVLLS